LQRKSTIVYDDYDSRPIRVGAYGPSVNGRKLGFCMALYILGPPVLPKPYQCWLFRIQTFEIMHW
jgi:hypothetical protein